MGPWADVGLAAAQANRGQRLALQGIGSLTPDQGIRALESLIGQASPQMAVVPFDLRQWREFYPALAGASLFAQLIEEAGGRGAGSTSGPHMGEILRQAEAGKRRGLLEHHLREIVAGVMRLDPSRIAVETSLGNLGLDSLMGLEIRNRLRPARDWAAGHLVWTYLTLPRHRLFQAASTLHDAPPSPDLAILRLGAQRHVDARNPRTRG